MNIERWTILGVIISVLVAIIAGFFLKSVEGGIIIGLLIEVIALQMETILRANSAGHTLETEIQRTSEITDLLSKVRCRFEVPGFQEQMQMLLDRLTELAQGTYRIDLRPEVYLEDAKLLKAMSKGEVFCATVPVFPEPAGQFEDSFFEVYLKTQIEAAKRGIQIERLYLFRDSKQLKLPEVQSHLNKLGSENISVRYIVCDELDARSYEIYSGEDFLLFRNEN